MIKIPLTHFHHLKYFATFRRSSIFYALKFAHKNISPKKDDILGNKYKNIIEHKKIYSFGFSKNEIVELIQGIPTNIRPIIDGLYLYNFNFLNLNVRLIGIEKF